LCLERKEWEIISVHNSIRANVVGFDHKIAVKKNPPIVCAISKIDLPNGQSIFSVTYEAIYDDTSNH
jgi:hypothetical protein